MWPNDVTKKDLRIDYYRGSGAGGQHRNKTDSACRITHIPTGIVAQCEDQRHQDQNKKIAFQRLAQKLIPLMKSVKKSEHENVTDTIRTYHEKRGTVKDHRISNKTFNLRKVLDGDLDEIIKELRV